MPKLITTPITADDLTKYVEESSSFQFEMDVFRSCLNHLFKAEHGGTYTDPVTQKDRQFDIRAQQTRGICTIKLAVECKQLKQSFPLLVSRVPRRREESFHEAIVSASNISGGQVTRLETRPGIAPFEADAPVGKSMAQVGKTEIKEGGATREEISANDAEVYEKWSQAVASAKDLVKDATQAFRLTRDAVVGVSVVLPVLVVPDDTLWTVDYSAEGVRTEPPKPIAECSYYLGKSIALQVINRDYVISHLLIFTKSGFDAFLDRFVIPPPRRNEQWEKLFPGMALESEVSRFTTKTIRIDH